MQETFPFHDFIFRLHSYLFNGTFVRWGYPATAWKWETLPTDDGKLSLFAQSAIWLVTLASDFSTVTNITRRDAEKINAFPVSAISCAAMRFEPPLSVPLSLPVQQQKASQGCAALHQTHCKGIECALDVTDKKPEILALRGILKHSVYHIVLDRHTE